ncbi:MAG: hypothetical protein BGN88_06935 [Clostridiales bacterium 43-6]|nr:MAG: hypothetical protein BGN88_06935 [Clostridiales bacterium 43-6]
MNNVVREIPGGDYAFLRNKKPKRLPGNPEKTVRLVDLFCGCGGISLGVKEACNTLNYGLDIPLAVDFEKEASDCYECNFPEANVVNGDITQLFSDMVGSPFTEKEIELQQMVGHVDLLVGGPPCQGHSDLNRYTKRNDPKNHLYLYMARAAELFRPRLVIIENVTGALHDKGQVVQCVQKDLTKLGYKVDIGIVDLVKIGVPQTRRRLILLASLDNVYSVEKIQEEYTVSQERTVDWAIGDLTGVAQSTLLDMPSIPSKENQRRIHYLFEHNVYDLPNEERPPCHRDKKHSYNSIYGRLHPDKPSQTITRGFYNNCMGRYVHPTQKRTLTAHEAARLQFFPDYFDFSSVSNKTALGIIVGNAVPMKLPYIYALALLSEKKHG